MSAKKSQINTSYQRKPVVLMSMGAQNRNGHDYQVMTNKYINPIVQIADCIPLLAPTSYGSDNIQQYLDMCDGVYLTGAATNIEPSLYGQENMAPKKPLDPNRDLFDIPLITRALEMGLPFFGVCRGMQEANVALGGDLVQKVYEMPNVIDHREDGNASVEAQYSDAHSIRLVPDTWYAKLLGTPEIRVNSLHGQGLGRLGKGIVALAHSEDGLIEAVDFTDYEQFTLGVQWHPEWRASQNPHSSKMFQAFGEACRDYANRRKA